MNERFKAMYTEAGEAVMSIVIDCVTDFMTVLDLSIRRMTSHCSSNRAFLGLDLNSVGKGDDSCKSKSLLEHL